MVPQQGSRMSPVITVLAGTLQEVLATLCRKNPDEVLDVCAGKDIPANPAELERLILQHFGDADVQEIVARRFRECEAIINPIPRTTLSAEWQHNDLFSQLDEGSGCILRTLSEQRYATLEELSTCSGLTHYEVLHRLREIIIPLSVKRHGRPVAVFRESGTDLLTGRQVAFSWWLNDDLLHRTDAVEVVEMDNTIIITLDHTGHDLPETLHASAACRHGILEIRVDTRTKGGGT